MRIAVSGTHFSGKSSLVAALAKQLPDYVSVDEPYFLLEEEGYEFPHPASLDDFEQQFNRSISEINKSGENTIFDRCPVDFIAYALVTAETSPLGEDIDLEAWIQKMEGALQLLDLIVFLPVEYRDRILVPSSQDLKFRANVDEKLQEILLEDSLEVLEGIEVLELTGSLEKRLKAVSPMLKM